MAAIDAVVATVADEKVADRPDKAAGPSNSKRGAGERIRQLLAENKTLKTRIAQFESLLGINEQDRLDSEQAFDADLARVQAQYPDFDAVVGNLQPLPPQIMAEIQSNEGGCLLLYHIGKFPALHHELVSLKPRAATHRIRRLCVELLQQSEQQSRAAQAVQWYRSASDEHLSRGR